MSRIDRARAARLKTAVAGVLAAAALLGCGAQNAAVQKPNQLHVVGVENFYADVAGQIGGSRVRTDAILSDPNVDPHIYESSVEDAKIVAGADIVVKNGAGYDAFIDKLLAASPQPSRIVIDVGRLTGHKLGDNPHLWYDTFNTMPLLAQALTQALSEKDPSGQAYFEAQGRAFQASLQPIQHVAATIQQQYGGAAALATEPLWNYQAKACGITVRDAEGAFQKATQDGNDPPAAAVVRFREQLSTGAARFLVVNGQAVTPLSQQMQALAKQQHVPVVTMDETEPPGTTYQQWMTHQLRSVLKALGG